MVYPSYSYGFFDFNSVVQQWSSIGLFDIVLPIILIFTIIYAILQRTKILGGLKGTDTVVALVIGFFSITNPLVSQFMIPFFSNVIIGLLIVLAFLLMLGFIMPGVEEESWGFVTLWGGIAIFLWVMSRAADYFGGYIIFSSQWWTSNLWWVIPLVFLGALIGVVVKGSNGSDARSSKQFKSWKELYGK